MSLLLNAAWEKDFNVLTVDCASIPSTCMSIIDVTVKSVKYIILNSQRIRESLGAVLVVSDLIVILVIFSSFFLNYELK